VAEFRERLACYVADLLGRGGNAHEAAVAIRRSYAESALYGRECSPPTTAAIIARAREIIVERTGAPREEHLRDAFAFYTGVIRNPETSTSEKLRARAQLDFLLDLRRAAPEAEPEPDPVRIRELVVRSRLDVDIVRRAIRVGVLEKLLDWLTQCEEAVAARGNGQPAVLGDIPVD
jgi:hypothetical protein